MFFIFLFLLIEFGSTSAQAQAGVQAKNLFAPQGVAGVVLDARERKLWVDPQWVNLVHYKKNLFGSLESQAVGASFFLAKDGKFNPQSELEATLSAFFGTKNDDQPGDAHPQCRFPARYIWLKSVLRISDQDLPPVKCQKFLEFEKSLSAESVTLIFSSYYLNNPSSAFGHSFIRINSSKSQSRKGEHLELLDHGINFAAEVTDVNPVVYVFNSLTGRFRGTFTRIPYYFKVREYNDFESRDLWGYDLNLTPEEVDMLVRHVWELGATHYNYLYFTQNCSYHVLTTLEAAAPRLHLTDALPFYVIPGDTIRVLFKDPNLVKKVTFRPSMRSVFQARVENLSSEETVVLDRVIESHGPEQIPAQTSKESKARILDAASDYLEFKYPTEVLKEDPQVSKWKQKLLVERAKTGIRFESLKEPKNIQDSPQSGHPSGRLDLQGGANEIGGQGFLNFGVRFALHDLLDSSVGYPMNSQIEFFHVRFKYQWQPSLLNLEEGTLFRVTSLSPWTKYKKDISFRVQVGLQRFWDNSCNGCLGGAFEAGPGITIQPFGGSIVNFYGIADFQVALAPEFMGSSLRLGAGPQVGVLLNFNSYFKALISGTYRYFAFASYPVGYSGSFETRYGFTPRSALNLKFTKWMNSSELAAGVMWYF